MEPTKKAIVIGATSGIGRGLAELLVKNGYMVGITGRREKNLLEIKQLNPSRIFIKSFDVQNTTDSIQQLEALIYEMDGLDLLIYSSGIGDQNLELDFNIELNTIQTNVTGFTNIATHVYNYFKRQDRGQIAGISSIAGFRGNPFFPAYSATKAYLLNYMESLRMKAQKEKSNITVTDLRAGFVKTGHVEESKMFWAITVDQAVKHMFNAIEKKKEVAYIKKRWWIISFMMKLMPRWIYNRLPF